MIGRTRRSVVLAVVLAVVAGGCAWIGPRPSPEPPAGSVLVGCDRAADAVEVTVSSHLDPECIYTGGVRIVASEVSLDCRGAVIRGSGGGVGILIESPADVTMSDVTVRNCRTEGFLNGMKVTRAGFRELAAGVEYDHALRDVVIRDSTVSDSRGVGIFVDGYVTRVTLTGLAVQRAGSAGIYLETGSRANTVAHNLILDNGFRENGPGGSLFELDGTTLAYWGTGREGLAIDGSSDNVVLGNYFRGNSAGGVFLYTNCGEYPDRARYFERRYPSDRNVISTNVFDGGWHGVWVGSRMGENVFPMQCTNEPFFEAPFVTYILDRAADNVVTNNQFNATDYGVRVEDDGTKVLNNLFLGPGPGHHAIIVGTPKRTEVLGDPIHTTTVAGNRSEIVDHPDPFRWVHGVLGLVDLDNVALGAPSRFCEGVPPPRNPFVMTIEVGLPNPDGSIPPRPGLALPVLGPIPACADPASPEG